MELLKTKNMGISFGGLKALQKIDIKIEDNELVGLIGPNGAGKTTLFNLLTGVYKPTEGEVYVANTLINKLDTYQIVALGISRTFQNIRLFEKLPVIDNVKIASDRYMKYNTINSIFRSKKYREEEDKSNKEALELLKIFDLDHLAHYRADSLSYGQQRKLEMARALATKPKLLLLDEPAAGMNPQETKELMEIIAKIREKFKISILLIEHDMGLVMGICERLYVLNFGQLIASGSPSEIQNNDTVIKAYLGE
ncbi:ABC transporter ATP-binding protein [Oceanivirga miroungae]|uniref:ATP-binding component of hemin transport system n=1 Tax=Oceanivirga miroungae TaxID=1130046 RepID=A0A6I8MA68_9FUSO|nr:ABC transporter ATP-binding protein [Oceanivirga miroungae]VWL85720.1 ATP-binding component of hemin transport system [Oceanivirga miroungae]